MNEFGPQDYKFIASAEGAGLTESYNWFKDPEVMQSFVDSSAELVDEGEIKSGESLNILGIGSGLGVLEQRTNEMLKEKGINTNLFVSDFSFETIADIIKSGKEGEGMYFVQDNKAMPIKDSSLDLVLARSVTHYEPTPELERKVLSEISRALKPGGHFIDQAPTLSTRAEADLVRAIHMLLPKEMNIQTEEETKSMLAEFFDVREASPEHQPRPLPTDKSIFMKRYSVEDPVEIEKLTQRIIEAINAVSEQERPNVWAKPENQDFGWNIPFTIYKCKKPLQEEGGENV